MWGDDFCIAHKDYTIEAEGSMPHPQPTQFQYIPEDQWILRFKFQWPLELWTSCLVLDTSSYTRFPYIACRDKTLAGSTYMELSNRKNGLIFTRGSLTS